MDNKTLWGGLMVAWIIAALPIMAVDPVNGRRKLGVPEPKEDEATDRLQMTKYGIWTAGFMITVGMWQLGLNAGYGISFTLIFTALVVFWWWRSRRRAS